MHAVNIGNAAQEGGQRDETTKTGAAGAEEPLRARRAFAEWWHNEGSGMAPLPGEDAEAHVHRVCGIAWVNGAYKASEQLQNSVANLRQLKTEHESARQAWKAVPASWHDTPEKAAAVARVDGAAGAVMRAEAAIIQMLLTQES